MITHCLTNLLHRTMVLVYLTKGCTRAAPSNLDHPTSLPMLLPRTAVGRTSPDHVKPQSVFYNTLNLLQWPHRPSAHQPTWAPSLCAANCCNRKSMRAWSAFSALRCSGPSLSRRNRNATLLEQEPVNWNKVFPGVRESAASVASAAVVVEGTAVPARFLNCLLLRTMSRLCALLLILDKSGFRSFGRTIKSVARRFIVDF
jgi:hypothetical protein